MASQAEKDAVPSRPELGEACPLSEAQRRRLFIDEYEFLLIWHPVAHCSASEAPAVRTRLPKRCLFLRAKNVRWSASHLHGTWPRSLESLG